MSGSISQGDRYLNFELSWLEFNSRVLNEACDSRTPLLERVRFLDIFSSNLDEFFMKRVGGLKRQVMAQIPASGIQKSSPEAQLSEVRKAVIPLIKKFYDCIEGDLRPALLRSGVHLLKWEELSPEEVAFADAFFQKRVFPVLTPLAVDPGHPFPFISNLSTSFGVLLKHPEARGEELFARVKIPAVFPSWIRLNPAAAGSEARFLSLYELIGKKLGTLFPGMQITDIMAFRVTRNADVDKEEEEAEDLLELVAEGLRERRFAKALRLEHGPQPNPKILQVLMEQLGLSENDVYELPGWLEYFSIKPLLDLNLPSLKYEPWAPIPPPELSDPEANIFEVIRHKDLLVHHPYESFNASVERFIRTAVEDPNVMAIKMTLYRTGEDSPFIPLLIRAAERGKQVAVLVELKARFDEERNILVAQALEKTGVHVVYGLVGLKTHCKLALVIRQEGEEARSYVHIGTGNYHARTARQYTDLGLFTAKPHFTDDVIHLFHYLTGRSAQWMFRKLLIAPIDMRPTFERMISREIDRASKGTGGRIIAKMNSLEDKGIIEALYQASSQGVKIDLIVRGACCLRPGIPGLSENIRVISVVGRFLEHSRLFFFGAGQKDPRHGEYFIGSADWMARNLNGRVEAIAPVEDETARLKCWDLLQVLMKDGRQAWEMQPDGTYRQRGAPDAADNKGAQWFLMRNEQSRARESVAAVPSNLSLPKRKRRAPRTE